MFYITISAGLRFYGSRLSLFDKILDFQKVVSTLLLPEFCCCRGSGSYLLLWYSFAFLAVGLIGALTEIDEDWLSQGKPFACP